MKDPTPPQKPEISEMDQSWQTVLQDLVDAGAELVVTDPDGTSVFAAPLARTWRIDTDDPRCLWVRPLAEPVTVDGTAVFALSHCRRRALHLETVRAEPDGTLTIALTSGQQASVQPVTGPGTVTLDAWDTFVGARLTAAEEQALDALEEDSWTGRYA